MGRHVGLIAAFARTTLQQHLAYPGDFWLAPIARLGAAFAMIGFWSAIYQPGASYGGLTRDMMLTWAAAGVVLNQLVNVDIGDGIAERIRRGDIVFEVLRPASFQAQAFGTWLGRVAYTLAIDTLPICIVLWGIARIGGPTGVDGSALAMLSLILAMLTAFLLQYSVILIGFWTIRVRTWTWLLNSTFALASGAIVPLWMLPDGLRFALQYTPISTLFHAPLSIFVGRATGAEAASLIAAQVLWLPVLWLISRWMMDQARRRVLIQGG